VIFNRDPLANPEPLIRRVYAYAAYRLGDGPDAEDATSDAFERALRYRKSYDPRKGSPAAWLIGIARRSVDDLLAARLHPTDDVPETAAPERDAALKLDVARALNRLDERDRELVALRYGADLTAKQIGELLELRTNAVEVALHRALARLRHELVRESPPSSVQGSKAAIQPQGDT
jgi:RNA polymerase sigma factor (sigma-70 family)